MHKIKDLLNVKESNRQPDFKSKYPPKPENMCDRCLSTHRNGTFHYLRDGEYETMFLCADRFTCTKIGQFHSARLEYVKKTSRMPDYLLRKSIDNFTITQWWQQNLMTTLSMWQLEDNKWVCITGGPGTGKTHVCSALVNELLGRGIGVIYTYYGEIIEAVKYRDQAFLDMIRNAPVLFLDDLYKGNITFQEIKETAMLINYRYTHDLVTLITTEKTPDELFDIDQATTGRIISRCDGCWADLPHDKESDYRIKDFLGMYDK